MTDPENVAKSTEIGVINITGLGSVVVYTDDAKPGSVFIATRQASVGEDGKLTGDDRYHIRYSSYGLYGFMGKLRQRLEEKEFDVARIDKREKFSPEIFGIKNDTPMSMENFGKMMLSELENFKENGFHSRSKHAK